MNRWPLFRGRIVEALRAEQPPGDRDRVWLAALLALAAIAAVSALVRSFASPFVIQDDARQFLFWMAAGRDPSLFQNDLLADYWQSVSPWLFVGIYRTLDGLGIAPLTAAKLFPPVLIVLTVIYAFRLAQSLAGDSMVAFVAAFAVLIVISHEDSVFSATPRAFALPLFLMVLDGVVRGRMVQATVAQLLAAGIYPQIAPVSLGIAGLTILRFGARPRLEPSWHWLALVGLLALATAAGLGPTLLNIGKYGPVVDWDQAAAMSAYGRGGRIPILTPQGGVDMFCSPVIGLEPRLINCNGITDPRLLINIVYLAAPAAFFLWQRLHAQTTEVRARAPIGAEIYAYALIVGLVGFALAWQWPFKLYWPGRYVLRPMTVLLPLAYGQLIGLGIAALPRLSAILRGGSKLAKLTYGGALGVLLVAAVASLVLISPRNRRPSQVELIQALSALPSDAVVAGFVFDLDFVPPLAKRRALFTYEHSEPIHLSYYREIEARMRDMAEAEFTPDPAVLAADLTKWSVAVYLINKDRLADPGNASGFESFVPDAFARGRELRQGAPTALSRFAPACTLQEFRATVMLDAACLVAGGTRLGARGVGAIR